MRRVTLIGYRASGKSTIGRLLAQRLGWPFLDADRQLERTSGRSIPEIFANEGEAGFRAREAACLATILGGAGPLVLATGGGCVLREENRALLAGAGGVVVYLHAPAATLQERLRHDAGGRPSLTGADVAAEVPALLAAREPLYRACAQVVMDATRRAGALVDAIAALVENPAVARAPEVDNPSEPGGT